ncbi:MAG TPA: efflux RND transporter periplasmic adaptor subunit [Thermoanaerobaculaceae bacterium]|nr:efflux RND transporter periplasmic adaptor subunit [Thermoanaerobaculaceae bacterium]HRS17627.1 efflux RND transporter periplasmic adaptor subunit [Thermoanaerobaculaceae bacterium]
MARKRIWVIVVVAVAVVGATVALATRRGNGEGDTKKDDVPIARVEAAEVQVEVLEVGTVEPGIKVDVKSGLSGKLVELPVREGDVVRKGQLLAAVEPDVNQAQTLATVRRSVNQAEIEFSAAQKDYAAKGELLRAGLLSIEAHRDAETRFRTAQEALEAAREKSHIVQSSGVPITANVSQLVNITAPMDGVVIRRPVELGEAVTGAGSFNAGTVIATIADISTMLVKAGVNEVDIGKVRLGAPVTVSLDAYPKVRFAGKVARIAPAARLAEQVKVFDVEIALDAQGKELRTGMTANISIKGERAEGVLAVPVEAVFRRDDGDVVYVRKATTPRTDGASKPEPKATPDPREAWKQRFEERRVETGLASLARVQVVAGLTPGEEVALEDPTRPTRRER